MTDWADSRILVWARRVFIGIVLCAIGAACVVFVTAILMESLEDYDAPRWLLTPVIAFGFGSIGLISTLQLGQKKFATLVMAQLGLLVLTAGCWLYVLWRPEPEFESHRPAFALVGVSLTAALVGLLLIVNLLFVKARSMLVSLAVVGAIASVGLCALAVVVAVWTVDLWTPRYDEFVVPTLMLWGLFSLLVAVGVPSVARRTKKTRSTRESLPTQIRLTLTCPLCHQEQERATGLTRCRSCRAALLIEIEEPRCECGYLTYQLQSDACPECGREIPRDQRWRLEPATQPAGEDQA